MSLFGDVDAEPIRATALLSPCEHYRYRLTREWERDPLAWAVFVMLNPSTADATADDPTIRSCVRLAKAWGCGGIHVVNLFAWRATEPQDLTKADDPVGHDNDGHLLDAAWLADMGAPASKLVAAWGVETRPYWREHRELVRARADRVRDLLHLYDLQCLGTTQDGSPRHPLYVAAGTVLQTYREGS